MIGYADEMTCAACGEIAMIADSINHAGDIRAHCPRCESDAHLTPTISYLREDEYVLCR